MLSFSLENSLTDLLNQCLTYLLQTRNNIILLLHFVIFQHLFVTGFAYRVTDFLYPLKETENNCFTLKIQ